MPHPFNITKLAQIHQDEMRRDAQRRRQMGDALRSIGYGSRLRKRVLIAAMALGSLPLIVLFIASIT